MANWSDIFKLFRNADKNDPLSMINDPKDFNSAGYSNPDLMGDISPLSSNLIESYEAIDTSLVLDRSLRYKEYEKLRNIAEIEAVMNVFADEACVGGNTRVATPFGFITIKELAEKKADQRFLVYCYDFEKNDYTLGWAFAPRLVKVEETITLVLDNGSEITLTVDHRVLKKDGTWVEAGKLKYEDELMPFYRIPANTNLQKNQFPRIFTFNKGWVHEKQFADEWKLNKDLDEYKRVNKLTRLLSNGLTTRQTASQFNKEWATCEFWLHKEGFTNNEIKLLNKNKTQRKIVSVYKSGKQEVYDLSVEKHMCFATDSLIVHNCQKDDKGNVCTISTKDEEIKEELEFIFFNRKFLNINRNAWVWFKNLCIYGDWFLELVINPEKPEEGIYKVVSLPPHTMWRIQTTKGKLLEFQQCSEGRTPDYQAFINEFNKIVNEESNKSTSIRFSPNQIIHMKMGDDKKNFYPYGQSLIEPARGPAHDLKLMEDSMLIYRLTRAPERRVFYVDTGQLSPAKTLAYMKQYKDQFRKRRVANLNGLGANAVDEKYQPPAQDEDYFVPVRANSNTRIETLPGAENLGEIDDAIYFRNKLLTSLNFPENYLHNNDPNVTRMTVSTLDSKFARMIERFQSYFEDGLLELAERHLKFRGYPEERFKDLKIKMTYPSEWREASRAELISTRFNNAGTLKGSQLMSDYDIYVDILKLSDSEAQEKIAKNKIQKLEDLKLQVLAQNPVLLGVGNPGSESADSELGTEAGGPNNMPQPEDQNMPSNQINQVDPEQNMPPDQINQNQDELSNVKNKEGVELPDPNPDEIKKYNLEILDYDLESDSPSIDYSEEL